MSIFITHSCSISKHNYRSDAHFVCLQKTRQFVQLPQSVFVPHVRKYITHSSPFGWLLETPPRAWGRLYYRRRRRGGSVGSTPNSLSCVPAICGRSSPSMGALSGTVGSSSPTHFSKYGTFESEDKFDRLPTIRKNC